MTAVTVFALVHGAWHGAWCWELLAAELQGLGHQTIAMDLPCDDASKTFRSYATLISQIIDDDAPGEEVVLVAHSTGGLSAPLVKPRTPIRRLVYLCALVASPRLSFIDQLTEEPEMINSDYLAGMSPADPQMRSQWVDQDLARTILFDDCDLATSQAAFDRLRPQALSPYGEPCPLHVLPETPATYVVCAQDRLVNTAWSRRTAEERLGADIIEIPGSHSPFLSRPSHLATVLDELV